METEKQTLSVYDRLKKILSSNYKRHAGLTGEFSVRTIFKTSEEDDELCSLLDSLIVLDNGKLYKLLHYTEVTRYKYRLYFREADLGDL